VSRLSTPRSRPRAASFVERVSAIDDETGPMGVRIVSQRAHERIALRGGAARLVVPFEKSAVALSIRDTRYEVERSSWALVPIGAAAVLEARSVSAHTAVLAISEALVSHVAATYPEHIDGRHFLSLLRVASHRPRSNWMNEICHRYVFERAACHRRDNEATRFLETEIAKEVFFARRDQDKGPPCAPLGRSESDLVVRARAHIEGHLFEADVLAGLAKACGASASTILRTFRRDLEMTPVEYLRARRLDESLLLLKTGRAAIGEISSIVGYRSLPAFSEAFRARFGRRPSTVRAESRRAGGA
jgi:AraC-like DNA-binding protein